MRLTTIMVTVYLVAALPLAAPASGQSQVRFPVFGGGVSQASDGAAVLVGTVGQPLAGSGFGFWTGPARTAVAIGEPDGDEMPGRFFLHHNYPNPFNPSTTIRYDVASPSHVRLEVFDLVGRRVAVLVDDVRPPGAHTVEFDAGRLASGLYLYFAEMGGQRFARSLVLMK